MSLELLLGPMFAGKSSAVLSILRRNTIINRRTLCITSALDCRYTADAKIVTHNKESHPAIAVDLLQPLLVSEAFAEAQTILIEEAQFFADLKHFVLTAVEEYGKHVICVGLDGDSERRPFGQLLDLIPYADHYQKLTALCSRCADGTKGVFTYRSATAPKTQINVGGHGTYEPLCRKHFLEGQEVNAFVAEQIPQLADSSMHMSILEKAVEAFGLEKGSDIYASMVQG